MIAKGFFIIFECPYSITICLAPLFIMVLKKMTYRLNGGSLVRKKVVELSSLFGFEMCNTVPIVFMLQVHFDHGFFGATTTSIIEYPFDHHDSVTHPSELYG